MRMKTGSVQAMDQTVVSGIEKLESTPISVSTGMDFVILEAVIMMRKTRAAAATTFVHVAASTTVLPANIEIDARMIE
jgi:hypothetical protein